MKYDNKDLAYIDKQYGENLAKFCRGNFPEILEKEGMLQDIITKNFAPTKSLYDDMVKQNSQDKLKGFILSIFEKMNSKESEQSKRKIKTPEELMDEAGYILFPECKTEKDIQAFRKYYYRPTPLDKDVENAERLETRQGEELCTFNGGRLSSCRVWFAVKKDAVDLNNPYYKRENWKEPKRQDDYGTSVLSIQFSHGKTQWLSIKNRYNHTITNPDATFSNNLENIRAGLTEAFKETYGINLESQYTKSFEMDNYVNAIDGKFYRFNIEENNVYYCENNVIIRNGQAEKLDQSEFILIDNEILDLKNKKFTSETSFAKSVGEINSVEILTNKEKKTRTILITPKQGEKIEIEINKHNEIIGYKNHNVERVGYGFLYYNTALTNIDIPNLQTVGNSFLFNNIALTSLSLPELQSMGDDFLYSNRILTSLSSPILKSMGDNFLPHNAALTSLYLPKLQTVGNRFLFNNIALTSLSLSELQSMGGAFLYSNRILTSLSSPKLKSVDYDFLSHNAALTSLYLPELQSVGSGFLSDAPLTSLYLPKLKYVGDAFLSGNQTITSIDLPNLRTAGSSFLRLNKKINSVNLPNLQSALNSFLSNNEELTSLDLPKLRITGDSFLVYNEKIADLNLPKLQEVGDMFLYHNRALTSLKLPRLKFVGNEFMYENNSITSLFVPKLKRNEHYFLTSNIFLKMKKFYNLSTYKRLNSIVKNNTEMEMQ